MRPGSDVTTTRISCPTEASASEMPPPIGPRSGYEVEHWSVLNRVPRLSEALNNGYSRVKSTYSGRNYYYGPRASVVPEEGSVGMTEEGLFARLLRKRVLMYRGVVSARRLRPCSQKDRIVL